MPWSAGRDGPHRYEIRIAGRLSGEWVEWFGLVPGIEYAPGGATVTVLRGTLADQAALFGVLSRIHGLGLELLGVRRVETTAQSEGESRPTE